MSEMLPFKKIAVIGAGTMGSGIAGQIANAGHEVLLIDLPLDDDANGRSTNAVQRLLKSDPPALMHKTRADLIKTGNTRDDFDQLAECDWIIEAVVERRLCCDVKHINHSNSSSGRRYGCGFPQTFCHYALFQPCALYAFAGIG